MAQISVDTLHGEDVIFVVNIENMFPWKNDILIFLTTPASQFVFAKLNLTFDRNTIFLVDGLSCINRVNSIVHFALPF